MNKWGEWTALFHHSSLQVSPHNSYYYELMSQILINKLCMHAKSLQSCPTLWDPMDYSPPGSPVHGILQARILEGVAMPSSRGSSCLSQHLGSRNCQNSRNWDFPGGPVDKTLRFKCGGWGSSFDPWLGELRSHLPAARCGQNKKAAGTAINPFVQMD